jgi:hypothetical protein
MTDVPVVWLGGGDGGPSNAASIDAWAKGRGVRLVGFASDSRNALAYPESVVLRVEQEISRAREATAALDAEASDAALARAESDLLGHPEIPQSAWLLAEILRGRAARARSVAPKNEARAEAAVREARGLDGGRASGIGEGEEPETPLAMVELDLDGAEHGEILIDGRPRTPAKKDSSLRASVLVSPGRHHVVLTVGGRPVWAAWTFATTGSRLTVPSLRLSCSRDDFAGVELRGSNVLASQVRCDEWVAARRSQSALFVARCSGDHCGPLVEWRVRLPDAPLVPRYEDRRVPAWATWTAIGAVAAVVAGVVLVGSGALETPPQTTRFSYGGVVPR